ncbi:MAG TPA: C13 family peptidase [Luteimonas sp.]|nr:C13 family peptidase [Luteimonas sp.]HRO26272.1 C13 family peptidase [Luteimonas sp.]HRP71138.1 C13 family peptidase [Luteimonas sp.]
MTRAALGVLVLAACWLWAWPTAADDGDGALATRDATLIDARLRAMPAQRTGTPGLYAIGFAGDGREDVFRNEVAYFETLASARFGADGRTIALVNHPDSLGAAPRPLATLDNLRHALTGVARAMDPELDLLLLFMTTHGNRDHTLALNMPGRFDTTLTPRQLRDMLDETGIRNRLVVVSACFSGGFIPALASPHTVVMTAARRDRTSFGCGDTASATYFGRAFLVEGMNRDGGLLDAFDYAKRQVSRRETMEGYQPSEPQLSVGEAVLPRLHAWEAALVPGPRVPYPQDP